VVVMVVVVIVVIVIVVVAAVVMVMVMDVATTIIVIIYNICISSMNTLQIIIIELCYQVLICTLYFVTLRAAVARTLEKLFQVHALLEFLCEERSFSIVYEHIFFVRFALFQQASSLSLRCSRP
jgi:hypothetical protein